MRAADPITTVARALLTIAQNGARLTSDEIAFLAFVRERELVPSGWLGARCENDAESVASRSHSRTARWFDAETVRWADRPCRPSGPRCAGLLFDASMAAPGKAGYGAACGPGTGPACTAARPHSRKRKPWASCVSPWKKAENRAREDR